MKLNFDKGNGLIPAVIQDFETGEILMLGFMNEEAYLKTKETSLVNFYSRTRQKLWLKGELSGDKLKVKEIFTDCDNDTILVKVELLGKAVCHTGAKSCFFEKL
jgi:phosphoribosyl-AMP cyclohydrolase